MAEDVNNHELAPNQDGRHLRARGQLPAHYLSFPIYEMAPEVLQGSLHNRLQFTLLLQGVLGVPERALKGSCRVGGSRAFWGR